MAHVFSRLFFSCVEENYAVSATITLPEEHFYCSGPSQRCASQVPFLANLTGFLILCFLWSTRASSCSTVARDGCLAGCLYKGGFGFSCQSKHSSLGCLVCRLCLWFFERRCIFCCPLYIHSQRCIWEHLFFLLWFNSLGMWAVGRFALHAGGRTSHFWHCGQSSGQLREVSRMGYDKILQGSKK